MIWIKDKPKFDQAWYWWKPSKNSTDAEAHPVYVRFENTDFQIANGYWSHCPIPYPEESNIEDC